MTIQEILNVTGVLPSVATTDSGVTIKLILSYGKFVCKAAYYTIGPNGESDELIEFGQGRTMEQAKDDLKNKIR